MLDSSTAFNGFAVKDIDEARTFYSDVLGVPVENWNDLLMIRVGGRPVLVYAKEDHTPATYTILNFPVSDIEAEVDALAAKGVTFEHYEGTPVETDAKGILRSGINEGPPIAWFTDPSGNVIAVIETEPPS